MGVKRRTRCPQRQACGRVASVGETRAQLAIYPVKLLLETDSRQSSQGYSGEEICEDRHTQGRMDSSSRAGGLDELGSGASRGTKLIRKQFQVSSVTGMLEELYEAAAISAR